MSEQRITGDAGPTIPEKWVVIGSGFVGSGLADKLRESNVAVDVVPAPRLNLSGRAPASVVHESQAHIAELENLCNRLAGATVVVNAAGLAEPDSSDTDELFGANALLPVIVAKASRAAGARKYIHLSSAAVQGDSTTLDDQPHTKPFSPYSASKALAETCLLDLAAGRDDITIIRATSVQGPHRGTTEKLQRFARSRLSSVASPGTQPSPVSSISGLTDFILAVGADSHTRAPLLLQPWEKGSVTSVLEAAGGGRRPVTLPRHLCRAAIGVSKLISKLLGGRFAGLIRRIELTWFGQAQTHSVPASHSPGFAGLAQTLSTHESSGRSIDDARIGILSQWFDPETGPAALPGVFARAFGDRGHPVSVLTGFPNYPAGKIYPGFAQSLRSKKTHGALTITRVPLVPSHDASALGRMVNYLSFSFSAATLGMRAFKGTQAIWVYNSPATVSLPLLVHTRMGRKPYFLHVQDLWPESLISSGMFPGGLIGRGAARLIRLVVGVTERRAAAIGVISPSVKQMILDRNPRLNASKIHYVPNPTDESVFVDCGLISEASKPVVAWSDHFTFMYVGAIGELQGLDIVLDAAKKVQDERIHVVIVGDGVARSRLARRQADESISNVTFFGRVPKEDVPGLMATSSVQIVSLSDDEFLRYTTPSKISSIMASALPILGQIGGDGAKLIVDSKSGLTVKPGDSDALAVAMRLLAEMSASDLSAMGRSGLDYYHQHISTKVSTAKILKTMGYTDD